MTELLSDGKRIAANRRLLGNQWAFVDGEGALSALPPPTENLRSSDDRITADRILLQDPYAHLDDNGGFSVAQDRPHAQVAVLYGAAGTYSSLTSNKRQNRHHSSAEIEKLAIDLQQRIWRDRGRIWLDTAPPGPTDILDPALAFSLIGYGFDLEETLGQYYSDGKQVEVAGIIDDSSRQVRISRQFPFYVRNFTAAHELGHALLHEARGLHRDRPLDGTNLSREPIEREADKFASYFLMPRKFLKACFEKRFISDNFFLNDETSFALTRGSYSDLQRNCSSLRDLSRMLASAESYNGVRFVSLASQFRVSTEAMAIRLEELKLLTV